MLENSQGSALFLQLCQVPSGSRAALVQLSKGDNKGSRSSSANTVTATTTSSSLLSSNHGFSPDEMVSDYENRIAFIQKQHEKLLAALHREVEQLKRKNKGSSSREKKQNIFLTIAFTNKKCINNCSKSCNLRPFESVSNTLENVRFF